MRPASESSNSSSDNDRDDDSNKRWSILRTIIGTSKQQRTRSQSPIKTNNETPSQSSRQSSSNVRPTTQRQQPQQQQQQQQQYYPSQELAFRSFCFKFSLEFTTERRRPDPVSPFRLQPPRLPPPAQQLLNTHPSPTQPGTSPIITTGVSGTSGIDPTEDADKAVVEAKGIKPDSLPAMEGAKYSGRALAEWEIVVWECQSFFERRKGEGVPGNRFVETPTLGVEAFRRPG